MKKRFLLIFIFVFSMLFCVGNVSARYDKGGGTSGGGCTYGTVCKYSMGGSVDGAVGNKIFMPKMFVYYQCKNPVNASPNNCRSYESTAHLAGKQASLLEVGASVGFDFITAKISGEEAKISLSALKNKEVSSLSINNYDGVFGSADSFKQKFISGNSFKCPTIYWASINGVFVTSYDSKDGYNVASRYDSSCANKGENLNDKFEQIRADLYSDIRGDTNKLSNGDDAADATAIANSIKDSVKNGSYDSKYSNVTDDDSCDIISDEFKDEIRRVLLYISIAAIVVLVVLSMLDFIKATVSSDDDALQKSLSKLKVRIISVVVLILLPSLVAFIINMVNHAGNALGVNADNPYCGVYNTDSQ